MVILATKHGGLPMLLYPNRFNSGQEQQKERSWYAGFSHGRFHAYGWS